MSFAIEVNKNVSGRIGNFIRFRFHTFILSHSVSHIEQFRLLKIVTWCKLWTASKRKSTSIGLGAIHSPTRSLSLTLGGDRLRCVSLSLFNYISARFIFMCCKQNTEASTTGQMPIEYVCVLYCTMLLEVCECVCAFVGGDFLGSSLCRTAVLYALWCVFICVEKGGGGENEIHLQRTKRKRLKLWLLYVIQFLWFECLLLNRIIETFANFPFFIPLFIFIGLL